MAIVYDNGSTEDTYGGVMGVGFATGFNVRYKFLMLGIEYNKVNMKLVDSDNSSNYWGNVSDPASERTPLPYWNIMFGFSF